ncbi:methyltransferase family protein [Dyadobacter psychrotolerans]|uniref:Isoprenylcysteine carboxylmethyltransferase family protein n=1 Tax=Dyadobacter psychrotolerans TaxID=2541721 RepID=A0A4R5DG53_9BACT|nr:isoprenylcysteine carboxylmethyltransferase family protein [Dyadobacter psychrotolerans]TDE12779.1 isoprenylcysteine carboxylmethyltransferase family protein [Dyadobacter psychrotolerans]
MNITFIITYAIWLISEVTLNRMLHSKSTDKQHADKNSLGVIWIVIILAISAANAIAMMYYLPIVANRIISYIGLAVIVGGIVLRFASIITLGRFFTVDVTIREGHQLKKDGLYALLRHPSYFASLFSFVGFGLSLNNWISLILVVVSVITVFIMRIKIEEKVLMEQFGEEYVTYRKRVKGLIPFVW